jgi:hypothetical protein
MLQPRTYPELVGKALVLESEPFVTMVEDDNPWVEGLFLVALLGGAVGLAQWIGGMLLTASMPPVNSVIEAVLEGWRQLAGSLGVTATGIAQLELAVRQNVATIGLLTGYGGGWLRLSILVIMPLLLVLQWLYISLVGHGVARLLGGEGRLNQTLGAGALAMAPHVLLLVTVIPFVNVSNVLLWGWSILLLYRGLEVAHELNWRRAVLAALAPPALLLFLLLIVGAIAALLTVGPGGVL